MGIIFSFIKVKSRTYRKHPLQLLTEVGGLALAICCGVLIWLYDQHERNYDTFHNNYAKLYRLTGSWGPEQKQTAIIPNQWAGEVAGHFPGIEAHARVRKMLRFTPLLSCNGNAFYEGNFISADSTFFDVFSFPLLYGEPSTALDEPGSILLTETKARKLFGQVDVLGKTITLDQEKDYKVTGVLKDLPTNSHLNFDFVLPIETLPPGVMLYSYFRFDERTDPFALESEMASFLAERFPPASPSRAFTVGFQPVTSIHLYSDMEYEFGPKGNETYLDLLRLIAVSILFIACFNFISMSMATASLRNKEYGIRKVMGSMRVTIIAQFVVETLMTMTLAIIAATTMIAACWPMFEVQTRIAVDLVGFITGNGYVLMFGLTILALACGLIPALTAWKGEVPRGQFAPGGIRGGRVRVVLVGVQLLVSFVLIAAALLIGDQLAYMRNKELGFTKNNVVVINARALASERELESAKLAFGEVAKVSAVSLAQTVPGDFNNMANISYTIEGNTDPVVMRTIFVDHDFVRALGIELVQGRNFSRAVKSDSAAYIINEAAARHWETLAPLNSQIQRNISDMVKGPVIGVVRDFHFNSLHNGIEPLVLALLPEASNKIIVRLENQTSPQQGISELQARWKAMFPDYPFQYDFLDESLSQLYAGDERFSTIFTSFALIAILLSCLGLYSMVAVDAAGKRKQVAVRKVFGASTASVVSWLLRVVMITSALAIVAGIPLAYLMMNSWLENFSYAVSMTPIHILTPAGLMLIIGLLSALNVVVQAASANPAIVLRSE